MEKFVDIKGFEGKYQISNKGRVLSLHYHKGNKAKALVPRFGKNGYGYVMLSKNNHVTCKKIHRLVCEHFIPNPQNKPYVNHKDGDKRNNDISNLEWVSPQENAHHAATILKVYVGSKGYRFDKNNNSRRVFQYIEIDGLLYKLAEYTSIKAAAIVNKYSPSRISQCCKKSYGAKTGKGFVWSYVELKKNKYERNRKTENSHTDNAG